MSPRDMQTLDQDGAFQIKFLFHLFPEQIEWVSSVRACVPQARSPNLDADRGCLDMCPFSQKAPVPPS